VRTIPAGAYVCMKGEAVDYWLGIVDGLAKMASNWRTGKATSFVGLSSGSWFGEGSLMKDEPRRYDVIALRESRIAYMKRSRFQHLLDHSIPFNRFLLLQLNERLSQFIGMIEHERLLDSDSRLARCLASMFNPLLYPGSSLNCASPRKKSACSPAFRASASTRLSTSSKKPDCCASTMAP